MTTILILYPSGPAFDLDYYLKTHMPLAEKAWKDFGLLGWEVVHYAEGGPYQISAVLKWESPEAFAKAASGPAAQEVFSDVPNFTTAQPVLLNGAEKGSSKL